MKKIIILLSLALLPSILHAGTSNEPNGLIIGTKADKATADVTPGEKDLFVDGTVEVDGATRLDGDVDVNASLLLDVEDISAAEAAALGESITLTTTQSGFVVVSATQAITLVLPAVSGNGGLDYVVVKKSTEAVAVTLDGNASETINGSTTNNSIDAQYDFLGIFCTGSEWLINRRYIQ
jgi:hypothetical protein